MIQNYKYKILIEKNDIRNMTKSNCKISITLLEIFDLKKYVLTIHDDDEYSKICAQYVEYISFY